MSVHLGKTSALALLAAFASVVNGCSTEFPQNDVIDEDDVGTQSIEQKLGLVPQIMQASDVPNTGKTLRGSVPRYVILSQDVGPIDIHGITISSESGNELSLPELFDLPTSTQAELQERDALLLISVPDEDAETLCKRFQFAYEAADIIFDENERLLFGVPASDRHVHALCMMPKMASKSDTLHEKGSGTSSAAAGSDGTQNYGAGSYTAAIKSLKCNDPRDWDSWGYNGDEARLRGFYNSSGGDQIWASDNVKSGNTYSPNRYIHFNSNAKLELYDYDSAPWNASDFLGAVTILPESACLGNRPGDFDGSGSGTNWNYDLTFKVYGPNCPCQTQEPAIYKSYSSETCSVTSSSVTSYTYYCSGGIYWRQAWGNQTRHCTTTSNKYNESCEMKTFVSSTVTEVCDHYDTGVAIGSPVQTGTCASDPCQPQVSGGAVIKPEQFLIMPPICP